MPFYIFYINTRFQFIVVVVLFLRLNVAEVRCLAHREPLDLKVNIQTV